MNLIELKPVMPKSIFIKVKFEPVDETEEDGFLNIQTKPLEDSVDI